MSDSVITKDTISVERRFAMTPDTINAFIANENPAIVAGFKRG